VKSEKKPALALVISAGKGKPIDDDEAPPSSKDMGDYDAVIGELADTIGVSEDRKADFAEAFRAAVQSCK
jgi:hypothetical protein